MRGVSTKHALPHLPFRILDDNPTLGLLHKHDEHDGQASQHKEQQHKERRQCARVPQLEKAYQACGKLATIPAKMMSEIPLPTPRDVICSPSHIRNMVPPTSAVTQVTRKSGPGFTTAAPL